MSEHAKVIDIQPYDTTLGCRVTGYRVLRRIGGTIVEHLQHITLEVPHDNDVITDISTRFKQEDIR